jgi:hypothetical protein
MTDLPSAVVEASERRGRFDWELLAELRWKHSSGDSMARS